MELGLVDETSEYLGTLRILLELLPTWFFKKAMFSGIETAECFLLLESVEWLKAAFSGFPFN